MIPVGRARQYENLSVRLLGRAYLLVHVELPEDLSGVKQMLVLEDPASRDVSVLVLAQLSFCDL